MEKIRVAWAYVAAAHDTAREAISHFPGVALWSIVVLFVLVIVF